jgi:hypothetical protein
VTGHCPRTRLCASVGVGGWADLPIPVVDALMWLKDFECYTRSTKGKDVIIALVFFIDLSQGPSK